MRRLGLVCAVLTTLGLMTGTAHAAPAASPGQVHRLHGVSHSSVSVSLSWTLPKAKAFRSTVVRFAAGSKAPRTVHAGRSAGRFGSKRTTLTVGRLTSGRSYAFSVFALDRAGHAGRRVSTVVAAAPAPATSLSSFATAAATQLTWTNPRTRTFARVVVRLAKGAAAPTSPSRGRAVRLTGARPASAALTGLARNTGYAVSVWALDRKGGYSTPSVARFTTSAGDDPDGTLTGVVQDQTGHALSGVDIEAFGDTSSSGDSDTTTPDGRYRLSVPADDYELFVDGDRITGGTSDATGYVGTIENVTVGSGRITTVPVIQLAPGAAITGKVIDASGQPVAGAYPYAVAVDRFISPDTDGSFTLSSFFGSAAASSPTAADGTFTLRGVATSGAVRLCASPTDSGHSTACADRTMLLAPGSTHTARDLVVPVGEGGTLSGTVRGAGGTPLADAYVSLENSANTDNAGIYLYSPTDSSGHYELDGVPAGSYRVCAQSSAVSAAHPTGFAPGCSSRTVSVSAGLQSQLDVTLPVGAALTGTVTGPSGQPIAHAGVSVQSKVYGAGARTNSHGQYTVTGLPAGSVAVCFGTDGATGSGLPTGVLPGCWRNGAQLTLSVGRVRSGIDVRLGRGGALSGTVLGADGKPAAFVDVDASLESDDEDGDFEDSSAQTDAAGRYTIRGLATGTYDVCFDTLTSSGTDLETCDQTPVKVTVGRTTAGVNGRLAAVSAISVTVQDAGGLPVAGVDAVALSSCSEECDPQPLFDAKAGVSIDASQVTDGTGTALLDGIAPGDYAVCLYAFNGTTDAAGGAPTGYADTCSGTTFGVHVARGATTHLNLVLPVGGAVSGTVTDAAHNPVAGVRALVSQSAGTDFVAEDDGFGDPFDSFDDGSTDSPDGYGFSAADGTYSAIGVRPGARTVCFDATDATGGQSPAGYRDVCLGGAPGSTTGTTTVDVTAGAVTAGVDVPLTAAGGVSGTVRHGTAPVAGAEVLVFSNRNVHDLIAVASTGGDGRYTVRSLAPGNVTLCVGGEDVHAQCYKNVAWDGENAPPLDEATLLPLTGGVLTAGVDVTLK